MIKVHVGYNRLLPQDTPTEFECAMLCLTSEGEVEFYDDNGELLDGFSRKLLLYLTAKEVADEKDSELTETRNRSAKWFQEDRDDIQAYIRRLSHKRKESADAKDPDSAP